MKKLLVGHDSFRRKYVEASASFLRTLASTDQNPDALFIGCSDSRVIPELLTNSSPGQLFVVRNIANLVPPSQHPHSSVGAAIEYAVLALGVENIIVCGHTRCGGVRAMLDGVDEGQMPSLAKWIRDAAKMNLAAQDRTRPHDVRWHEAIEENVLDQLDHLLTYPAVAQKLHAGKLHLHGWVYDLLGGLTVYDPNSDRFVEPVWTHIPE